MRIKVSGLATLAFMLVSLGRSVSTQEINADLLRSLCADGIGTSMACNAYFTGWLEGYETAIQQSAGRLFMINEVKPELEDWHAITAFFRGFCIPEGVTKPQITEVVLKYIETHPEMLHEGAGGLASQALESAYPCD